MLCQQRKVRCNRKFPCANCTRVGVTCVPATLAPRRPRRKLVSDRELLDRVRKYEDLLRQNNVKFEPFRRDPARESVSPSAGGNYDSDDEPAEAASVERSSPSATVESERVYEAKYALNALPNKYCHLQMTKVSQELFPHYELWGMALLNLNM